MSEDTRLRQKAVKLTRKAEAVWTAYEASGFTRRADAGRFLRAAHRAEAALFRVVRDAPDDPGPRFAYGNIMLLQSWIHAGARGRLSTGVSDETARGALWAFNRAEFNDLDPLRIAQLAEEPPVETEFTSEQGVRPRPPGNMLTPEALDAYFRSDDKVHNDKVLVWSCQLTSCRSRDAAGEARILLTEAAQIYRVLEAVGNRFGPDDAERAEQRREAVLKQLPLDLR